jgi:hypothetical protein
LFAHTADRVRKGLMTPTVCLSYGGDLEEMRALPGYDDLRVTCQSYNVEMFESVMSLTGMVNVGKGALVVGFASEPHASPADVAGVDAALARAGRAWASHSRGVRADGDPLLPEPPRSAGRTRRDGLRFTANGAGNSRRNCRTRCARPALFERWRGKQDDPDGVDHAMAATDPQATVTGRATRPAHRPGGDDDVAGQHPETQVAVAGGEWVGVAGCDRGLSGETGNGKRDVQLRAVPFPVSSLKFFLPPDAPPATPSAHAPLRVRTHGANASSPSPG